MHNEICAIHLYINKGLFPLLVLPCQMIFKSLVYSRRYRSSWDFERHEEPEKLFGVFCPKKNKPVKVVDDLNPTEDGEASEKAHRASNEAQLGLEIVTNIIIVILFLTFNKATFL